VQLLKPESVARIETATSTLAARSGLRDGYGLGNFATVTAKAVYRGHDGAIDGFFASYLYNAEHKAGAVMMTNMQGAPEVRDALTGYLERDWPAPTVAEVPGKPGEAEALAGYYQSITPRQALLAPIQGIGGWTPVEAREGKLFVNGTQRRRVGQGLFQKQTAAAPNIVFAQSPDGPLLLTELGADRRVPEAEIALKALAAGLYVLTLVFALIYALVWLIGWLRGKLGDRGGVLVRLVPTLALLAPMVLFGLFLTLGSGGTAAILNNLGTPSPGAVAMMFTSYAIPVLAVASFIVAVMARGAPAWVRGFALLSALLGFAVTAYLLPFGWIGVQTWA
jgi:hypothetical protein